MFALFDIGGTKTRVTVSRDGETLMEPFVFHTEQKFSAELATILDAIDQLGPRQELKAAAGGIAGPLDSGKTKLLTISNLPAGWANVPIKEELQNALGVQVYLENDTALVGLGEAHNGAGRGAKILAYITVSTGLGGVRIVDGMIDKHHVGFEPGHQIINYTDALGGEAESYISGWALEKRSGKKPYEIQSDMVWDAEAKILAVMLHNTIVLWSPDTIVLGGSMIVGTPAISISQTEEYLKKILRIFPEIPILKKAELGDTGGLYGALAYLRHNGFSVEGGN